GERSVNPMANGLPEQPGISHGAPTPVAERPAGEAGGGEVTGNHMLWVFAFVFLGLVAPFVYVYLRVPMPGATREWVLLPAAFFGLLGCLLLVAAACGVWSRQPLRLGPKPRDESSEPQRAKPADDKAALARLEASP